LCLGPEGGLANVEYGLNAWRRLSSGSAVPV
jgi:hypothetical protein